MSSAEVFLRYKSLVLTSSSSLLQKHRNISIEFMKDRGIIAKEPAEELNKQAIIAEAAEKNKCSKEGGGSGQTFLMFGKIFI